MPLGQVEGSARNKDFIFIQLNKQVFTGSWKLNGYLFTVQNKRVLHIAESKGRGGTAVYSKQLIYKKMNNDLYLLKGKLTVV